MKTIVISAINIYTGGPLTIVYGCLDSIIKNKMYEQYKIVVLVHKCELYEKYKDYITLQEYPDSRTSWIRRLLYEYKYFKKLSKKLKPYLWFSLHDITPNVTADIRAVYCHNSTPFYKLTKMDLKFDKKIILFSLLYKYLYKINIKKNDYVVVQQNWLKKSFVKMYKLQNEKVVVARVALNRDDKNNILQKEVEKVKIFFFPSISRQFKNFETICEAVKILNNSGVTNFKVKLTLNGTENKYAKWVYEKFKNIENIDFCGLIPFEQMSAEYDRADCLIFPSKLETWGLPISEFLPYNKPMLIADLPYAHETSAGAKKVSFFEATNPRDLAEKMESLIKGNLSCLKAVNRIKNGQMLSNSWRELFNIILN